MQVMKNTAVEFILVQSSVYHCLHFLNLPLVISDGFQAWPLASSLRLPVIYSLQLSPSVVNLVNLESAVRLKHYRIGQSNFCW